ncbi:hypothetical protein BC332_33904 [Capsicum chinense]|nr:hypothetical protein BC332_33904 [Capsicum chinense]
MKILDFFMLYGCNNVMNLGLSWICPELLLSIPKHALKSGSHLRKHNLYFLDTTLIWTFDDIVDSCSADAKGCQINRVVVSFRKGRFDGLYLSWHRHPADCLTATGKFSPLSVRGLTMQRKVARVVSPFMQTCFSIM